MPVADADDVLVATTEATKALLAAKAATTTEMQRKVLLLRFIGSPVVCSALGPDAS